MAYRRRHREKLLFLMFAGAAGIILLVIGGYQLVEFMDSTAFSFEGQIPVFFAHAENIRTPITKANKIILLISFFMAPPCPEFHIRDRFS